MLCYLPCRLHRVLSTLKSSARLSDGRRPAGKLGCCRCAQPAPVRGVHGGVRETRRQCRAASAVAGADPATPSALLHTPVLLDEVVGIFASQQLATLVDATLGAGGHAAALLAAHPELRWLVGVDVDPSVLAIARGRLSKAKDVSGSQTQLIFQQVCFIAKCDCASVPQAVLC